MAYSRKHARMHKKYWQTVIARAKQLQPSIEGSSVTTTNALLTIQQQYYVRAQDFRSCISLDFIYNATTYDAMKKEKFCRYLDKEIKDWSHSVALEGIDEVIEKMLKMNMDNKNARFSMQGLFDR